MHGGGGWVDAHQPIHQAEQGLSPQTVAAVGGGFEGETASVRDGGQPLGGIALIRQRFLDGNFCECVCRGNNKTGEKRVKNLLNYPDPISVHINDP